MAAFAAGESTIHGLSPAFDCISTALCLGQLGLEVEKRASPAQTQAQSSIVVRSKGLRGLTQPDSILFAANSGTTMRLLAGLSSGLNIRVTLDGDNSLRRRPMGRIVDPLSRMGARIVYLNEPERAPFSVEGGKLSGQHIVLPFASAQVQTGLLLAGLQAEGETTVHLPAPVRDHTERMFKYLQIPYGNPAPLAVSVKKLQSPLDPFTYTLPSDISSAAFFMVAAACLPDSELLLLNLVMNPGRTLVVQILQEMGADISLANGREECGEPVADLYVRGGQRLKGISIGAERLAAGIDEIPALALAGSLSDGQFCVRDASELRVKESDRLHLVATNLRAAGAKVQDLENGFIIEGQPTLPGGSSWQTNGDHRIAMAGFIASELFEKPVQVDNEDCVSISYPGFRQDLSRVLR